MKQKMQKFCKRVIATVCAASMVFGGVLSDIGAVTVRAAGEHTLWLVGDSTVSAFSDKYYAPRYGYGTQIGSFVDDTYTVKNLAVSGSSSRSFADPNNSKTSAQYSELTSGIKAGDALIIGFGHNDQKAGDTYTSPVGDWTKEGSFAKSLYDNYVKVAQDAGAEVILCTPIVRRPNGDFNNEREHITAEGSYPDAIRKLGTDKQIPVVDLTALTKELYTTLTPDQTKYLHAWQQTKETTVDNTHLNLYGAKRVAWMLADGVKALDAGLELKAHITATDENEPNDITAGWQSALTEGWTDPTYTPPADNAQSKLCSDYVIGEGDAAVHFKGTAFGQLGGNPSAANHILGTDDMGNMHIAVKNNKGKITANEDGIAMYYYRVPAASSFKLSAKATVNQIDINNQVAFGLMARDDMYIDTNDGTIKTPYVAAGSLGTGCNCFYRDSEGTLKGTNVALQNTKIEAGASYNLVIETTNEGGLKAAFDNEPAGTEGTDFRLTSVDADYVYIGMFVARNADVTFSQIHLEVDGQVIADNSKDEYTVTVSSDENGSAKASAASAPQGATVKLTATPNEGYLLKEWQVVSGDVTIENNQFTMPAGAVEVKAVFEKIRTEWDFAKDNTIAGKKGAEGAADEGNGVLLNQTKGTLAGLEIDATTGKFDSTDSLSSGWAQFNKTTTITVPVPGLCKVTVKAFNTNYSVDGKAAAAAEETFICEGKKKKVVITATDNTYLGLIRVEELSYLAAGATDFKALTGFSANQEVPSNHIKGMTLTGFNWNGTQHGLGGSAASVMTLSLQHKANITIKTCTFGAGTNLKINATSGTVTSVVEAESDQNAADSLKFTIKEADAGDLKLTFEGGQAFIHDIYVDYIIEVGPRNIDVWDLGGKEETDTKLYTNNITPQDWIDSGAVVNKTIANAVTFGDLTITPGGGDRLYTNIPALADLNYGAFASAQQAYDDGYTAAGAYYTNGTGGASRRYLTIANVQAGDKIVAYMGVVQKGDSQFFFEGLGGAAGQKDAVDAPNGVFGKYEFVAEKAGSYKIWENNAGKPMWHRVMRVPGVAVSGSIDLGEYTGTGHSVKFVNQTTRKEIFATLDGNNYTVTLPAGYTYAAVLVGATGYGFTSETRLVTTVDTDCIDGIAGHKLVVVPKTTYTYSGKFTGFADGYDVSGLTLTMVPPEDSDSLQATGTIDENLNFSVVLDPDVAYTIQLGGVNDYEVKSETTIEKSANYQADITVGLKPMYDVSGKFTGLGDAPVTALTFVNVEDKYEYTATVNADGSYSIKLRDGSYETKAVVDGYSTRTHVVVNGEAVSRDLMFVSAAPVSGLTRVSDIYVGYPGKENNYDTVRDAVAACAAMNPTKEEDRITVHIAPGTYREQVVVKTPYISFVNDEQSRNKEVLITWYYGIGYKYYSANEKGFYDPEYAYDKFDKHIAEKWGATVFVDPAAKAFRADGITFENSFNRYLTDEELEDGVEHNGTTIQLDREYGVDVESRAATERAAAIVIQADQAEFNNCAFYSSQDTVYGTTKGSSMYFKNCFIEGQTDYIFGEGNAVFDSCELSWKGYSGKTQGGYITAHRFTADGSDNSKGYLFRNCVVSADDKLAVASGYFGRPWNGNAKVVFLNTRLQSADMIHAGGWSPWSGTDTSVLNGVYYKEYNTTLLDGGAVDTSKRNVAMMTQAEAEAVKVTDYFGSWTPSFYREEAAEVAFATKPFVTDNGDLNTPYPGHKLTVGYSLGEANDANDASLIQWYRVKDGKETLVKSASVLDKTYKIAKEDVGSQIKVVVTPITVSGNKGTAESCTVEAAVREGYEDPDATGGDAELGDGVNIFLAGDSTVKDYSATGINSGGSARSEGAWGEFLQSYFNKDKVTVVNYANGGRSVRNFINEGSLDTIAGKIGEGDYLFIQFGHNDCSDIESHLAERYVPLGTPDANGVYPVTAGEKTATPAELANKGYGDTCYTYDCGGTYKWYLKQYIDVAKKAGATPVLVTPVSRMYYNADGTIKPHHDSNNPTGKTQKTENNAYVTAVRQLAKEENVLLVDGFELTKTLFEDAWKAANEKGESDKELYGKQIMHAGDKTHNNKLGGMIEAAAIASAIQNMELNISHAVKAPAQVQGKTAEADSKTVFVVNGKSEFTAYDVTKDYAEHAPYWETTGQKMIDAIGEKAKELAGSGQDPEPGEYTIIIDRQDGSKPVEKVIKAGTALTETDLPANLTKEGHIFKGWTDEEGNIITVPYTPEKSMTIRAKWQKEGEPDPDRPDGLCIELVDGSEFEYTGSAIKPAIEVYNNGELLEEGVEYTVKYSANVKAADKTAKSAPKITVSGKGNLTGSTYANFTIKAKDISDDDVIQGDIVIAAGSKAAPVLVYNNMKLGTKDYEFAVKDDAKKKFTESGTIVLNGKGNYTGSVELDVTVVDKKDLKKFTVEVGKEVLTYNGDEQRPTITVKDSKSKDPLDETMYTIVPGGDETSAGTQKFTVIGMSGGYTGTVAKSYKIKPLAEKNTDAFDVQGVEASYTFRSAGVTLGDDLKVYYGDAKDLLTAGKDYKVTYSNNKKVSGKSQAKYTISFMGNYKGSTAKGGTFAITPAPLSNDTDGFKAVSADKTYKKPNQYKSAPYVTINGVALKGSDYKAEYYLDEELKTPMSSKNKVTLAEGAESATVWVKITGKGNYAPADDNTFAVISYEVCKVREGQNDLAKARVTFVDENGKKLTKAEYTGLEVEPAVKVEIKDGKTWKVVDSDQYEVAYLNNVNKGRATAVITATGEGYVSGKTATFNIVARNLKNQTGLWSNLFNLFGN